MSRTARDFFNGLREDFFGGISLNIQSFCAEKADVGDSEKQGEEFLNVIKTAVVISDISACRGDVDGGFDMGQSARNTCFVVMKSQAVDTQVFKIDFEN